MAATLLLHLQFYRVDPSHPSRSDVDHGGSFKRIKCSDSSKSNRGFDPKSGKSIKKMKSSPKQSSTLPIQAPGLIPPGSSFDDLEFEQRLQAVRMSALEQKKAEEEKEFGTIDYDATTETNSSTTGMGIKIGVGFAVVALGLVFAVGDFLPPGSVTTTKEAASVDNKVSAKSRENLEKRLKLFEGTLGTIPEDSSALEGAAVTLAEMGEYKKAATLLEKLTEKKPSDPDAFRLLGEVKYELKDYEGSIDAYKSAERLLENVNFEVLRGLSNALMAAKKPDKAVQVLLASRERLRNEQPSVNITGSENGGREMSAKVDQVQVDLLLGKAYSDWGHISDAVSVYDQLISCHPNDFRGYLAKGIILKENGNIGDAERMFIQARFFAPDSAKFLVDKYSR